MSPSPFAAPAARLISLGSADVHHALATLGVPHLPLDVLSDQLVVGSPELHQALRRKIAHLLPHLAPTLAHPDARWPNVPADVLALDMALVPAQSSTPAGQPWDLAWVEIQAFTSMLPSCLTLQHAHAMVGRVPMGHLPHDPLPWGHDWRTALQTWVAPHPSTVLIEDRPTERFAWADLAAARHWWGVAIHDWRDLRVEADGSVWVTSSETPSHGQRCHHLWNRVVLSDLAGAARHQMEQHVLGSGARVTWHSHPGWYDTLSKGALANIPLAAHEACHWADDHAHQDPAGRWVAKPVQAHSGEGVIFDPTPAQVRALPRGHQWLVQRRFEQCAMGHTAEGAPLFGEIRCMLGLRPGHAPWVMAWIVRLSRNGVATMTGRTAAAEEGMSLLYFPVPP